jgi:hypothetical protein
MDRRVNAWRLCSWAVAAALSAMIGFAGRSAAADWADFPPTSFKIYSEDGSQMVGHSRYFVERLGSGQLRLHGENHYLNGQHDIELDTLALNPGEEVPRLRNFSHVFYKPDGSLFISGTANMQTGEATCTTEERGQSRSYSDQLEFPADTYAGASILIPIEHALRSGVTTPVRMHFFDCTPKPRLLTIEATPNRSGAGWQYYPGQLVEVLAKPDLGWLDLIAAPFLPTMHAWFNPAEGFSYVGGGINRYFYSKAHVMLVKTRPGEEIAAPEGARSASVSEPPSDGVAAPAPAAATPTPHASSAAPPAP